MYQKWSIENSPLQAYASALMFSPARSLIKILFKEEEPNSIAKMPVIGDKWSACLQTLEGHGDSVSPVAFYHNSTRIVSVSVDKTVKIWDASSGECLRTLDGHRDWVWSVAFSHDLNRLASASVDKTIKIWDVSSGECLQTLGIGKWLNKMSFDISGSYLHTGIGKIAVDASSSSNTALGVADLQSPRYQGWALSSDGAWITYNSMNWLWLRWIRKGMDMQVQGR
jgi:WD40 repeat protein